MRAKKPSNKKGMIPRDIIISIIIFGMFMTGFMIIIGSTYESYGTPVENSNPIYRDISDVTSMINQMESKLKSSGTSLIGFLEYISSGAWSSLILFMNSGSIISKIVKQAGIDYNIPSVFILTFIAIVGITIIFGVISAIFRKKT